MKSSLAFRTFCAALVAGAILGPLPAWAQVEEIVITAQRREQQMQRVPISVTAFTAETLKASGVFSTQDVSQVTPGFQVGSQLGANILNIRGVGSQTGSAGDEASVATYIDGFYLTDGRATIFDLNNIERIEVLKGPQGTLFGRNATGGLVQIITRTPSQKPLVEAAVGYGNHGSYNGSLYATGGISENLAADFAVAARDQDEGFGTNLTTGNDVLQTQSVAARTKWVLSPSETFKQTIAADFSDWESSVGVARKPAPGAYGVGGYQTPAGTDFRDVTSNYDPLGRYEQWGVSSRTEFNAARFDIVNLAQYRDGEGRESVDQDATPATIGHFEQHTVSQYWTEELQFISNESSPFDWIVGGFYFDGDSGFDPLGFVNVWNHFASVSTRSWAAYAQTTFAIARDTELTTGVRYTRDRRELTGARLNLAGVQIAPFIPATLESPSTSSKPTWRVALDHHFSDDKMAYVSYSRGFKSGVYAASNFLNPLVEPETLDAYEVGFKSDWLNRTLRLNGAVYHYRWSNIQLTQTIPGGSFLLNAALGEVDGGELELRATPSQRLDLHANVSVIDAKYKRFPGGPCFLGPNPAGGTRPMPLPPLGTANPVVGACDLSGNDMLRTPPVTFNVGFDYSIPSRFGELAFASSYYYNDGFFWEGENRLEQDSYGLLSAQASWAPNDRWQLRVWGKNLTDEEYNAYATANGAFGDSVSPAPGRIFGVAVQVSLE